MKYAISLMLIVLLWACDVPVKPMHSTHISVVVDRTDPFILLPQAEPILGLYGFANDKDQKASFRISTISDMHLNPATEFNMPNSIVTEKENQNDDPQYREKIILKFYDAIRDAIGKSASIQSLDSSLQYSECFSTIAKELRLLQKKKMDRKFLFVFSDLNENSLLFNSYRNIELIQQNPDEVIRLFQASHLLPESLQGISVVFIYLPKDRQADLRYAVMAHIYQTLLESLGAEVIFQTNNTNYGTFKDR